MATVSVGQQISASQYNDLQSRVANILGTGAYSASNISANSGYGQSLSSGQVSSGTTILASHMDALRTDINKCNNHQIGADGNIGNIQVGQIIAADTSSGDTNEGYNDYDAAITVITSNKFSINGNNATSGTFATNSVRTTPWNGTIKHEVTVTFTNFEHRRYFFNAGGEIRFSATLTGASGAKGADWAGLLTNAGTIKFRYDTTVATGTGNTNTKGNYNLTTTPEYIFSKNGSAAVYAENVYIISASHDSATGNKLYFKIWFIDNDAGDRPPNPPVPPYGPLVDENIDGTLTSYIQYYQPTGSNVEVALPSVSNTTTLA